MFITAGAISASVGLVCFANPQWISDTNQTAQIVFALASLWVLNIGLNVMQGPGSALSIEMCTVKQQKMGNAIISTLSALSGIITNLLGFVNLTRFLPFFQDDAHALLYIGVITVIVTLIPTLIAGKEKRFVPKRRAIEGTKKDRKSTRLNSSHRNTSRMPSSA